MERFLNVLQLYHARLRTRLLTAEDAEIAEISLWFFSVLSAVNQKIHFQAVHSIFRRHPIELNRCRP